jgi:predicted TIM-barrel fold metal-dependent hydrolase
VWRWTTAELKLISADSHVNEPGDLMKPSGYFRRQCYATFIDDPVGVATRQFIGVSNIMWSSDYPHTVSTWPHSREVVERDSQGVPESKKWQMVRGNAIQLSALDLT